MRTIRRGVFESNSSSTHSIAISKEKVPNVAGRHVYFGAGEYGWGQDCVGDTASYLHTAIVDSSTPAQYEERINKLKKFLTGMACNMNSRQLNIRSLSTILIMSILSSHLLVIDGQTLTMPVNVQN